MVPRKIRTRRKSSSKRREFRGKDEKIDEKRSKYVIICEVMHTCGAGIKRSYAISMLC